MDPEGKPDSGEKTRLKMILDCRSDEYQRRFRECMDLGVMPPRYAVFVDGQQIPHAWYADDEAGIVRTYDIEPDQTVCAIASDSLTTEQLERGLLEEWDMPDRGPVSRTIRGKVELRPLV
jgi:hypothetical protein